MADEKELNSWLKLLGEELDRRQPMVNKLDRYFAGIPDPPEHVRQIKAESEYRVLMRQSVTNWPELIVDAPEERLEVTGFRFGAGADDDVWGLWQRNSLDANSSLLHQAALRNGRAYAIVWADADGEPLIVGEHASTTAVAYSVTSGRREAALRRWQIDDRWHATLFLPDGLYKFRAKSKGETRNWERREVDGEAWPLPNPLKVVPVVELAVNRSLGGFRATDAAIPEAVAYDRRFGTGAGEYERVLPIIDRINTTIFSGLLAQTYTSFPVRALIGEPIQWEEIRDDDGNVVDRKAKEPFQIAVNRLIQIENKEGRLVQLPEADLTNCISFAEMHIRHLAAITKTPPHYLLGEMVNLSADAIRAGEAGLVSKVYKHQRSLGEAWEEIMRLALRVAEPSDDRGAAVNAETVWKNPESRSLAERADAASKLKDVLSAETVSEYVLDFTPQQIQKFSSNGGRPREGADASQ